MESEEYNYTWREIKGIGWQNKISRDYLEEFHHAKDHLNIPDTNVSVNVWGPPPASVFKLNFDAAIFLDSNSLGFGAII